MQNTNPFTTYVVGSLPRPRWVREVIEDRKAGRISYAEADRLLDSAVPSAVRLQERAGLDFVSDGEWRRESYIKVISEHVDGFELDAIRSASGSVRDPAVVRPLKQREPLTLDGATFLKAQTDRRTIVAIPSPYILGWRMWRQEVSANAYPTRVDFMEACVPIIRAEIVRLFEAGVHHVQIDEPWLLLLVDPAHRERMGINDMQKEIELCVRMVNAAVRGSESRPTSMHLCHAHFARRRTTDGSYEPIIDALGDINVSRFAMEFAAPQSHGVDVLARFPKSKVLGLGVIDHCEREVETPETVAARVEAALRHVAAERVTLNPDCGFSPSTQNPMDLDEAYLKLKAMCEGAELCRKRFG